MVDPIVYTSELLSKRTIADHVLELRFVKPTGFTFLPGQFVQFRIPEGDKFILRSYSIASAPHEDYLEFCVKVLPDGKASALFAALPVGATADFTQARGMFTIKPEAAPRKVFIATGTGLAPIMSMLASLAQTTPTNNLRLIFGVRSAADLFWAARLEQFTKQGIATEITLSRPEPTWTGIAGRVTTRLTAPDSEAEYYVCGSLEMVKDVRAALTFANVPAKQVHFEIF